MPKALQRLPLLQTLNSLQLIDALNSDSDSDIQEDIILLDMIKLQRCINPPRRYPSHYMYTMNDLQTLSSERFQQQCKTTHESFEKLVAKIKNEKKIQKLITKQTTQSCHPIGCGTIKARIKWQWGCFG
ncbi:hypothetical protein O181_116439 [Austropuccinia psidii MF-1]|uniref:Uncharacterized protein n=1 Tax=Austropuccinia psidii MF-1 TaxID=1389203 RepID=A0A9Q3PWI9_9BASI|nr:hypothetical protein [Austropuccinia psidii MF-1]